MLNLEHCRQINDLPPEILADIFTLCTLASTHPTGRLELAKERIQRWTNFTHVCSLWRAIALGTPSIWCRPDFSLPDLAAEMLERSGSVPLDLELDSRHTSRDGRLKNHRVMTLLQGVLADLSRIRSLQIQTSGGRECDQWVADLLLNMGRPAPYLSSLHLFLAPRGLDAPLLQDISFDGDYPHLQILNIYGCDIGKLDLGSMRRLKYFRVCYPFGNILLRSLPSVTYLLRQLDYIQSSLQYLELERCWISNSTGSNLNLSFPRLRRLIISSTFAAVTSLLPYLAFPATTGVRIMSFDISDSDFHTLVAWLTQCFARSSSRGYRRIEYLYLSSKVDGLKGIMLSTWPDSNTNGERAPSQFSLRLHASVMMMGSQDSRIDNLLSVLPLADLQRLRYCFSPDESESLLQYFQTLPSLHTIEHIGAAFLEKTVRALTQDQRSGRSSIESHPPFISDTFVPFPALRHIVLESLDFSLGVQRVWQPDLWPDRFAEALLARHEHGAPLPAIVLKKCRGVDMDYIEKLRSLNISVFVEDD